MQFSITNKDLHRSLLSFGLVILTLVFMGGVFGLISLSTPGSKNILKANAAELVNSSTTSWKKIGGLPQNYDIRDVREINGETYLMLSEFRCETCGVFKLNKSTLNWDKILPNPGDHGDSSDLWVTSNNVFYTLGNEGTVKKFNTSNQTWEIEYALNRKPGSYPAGIDINSSNRHAFADTSLTFGPNDQLYATAIYPDDNKNYVIRVNKDTNAWEKVGPVLPEFTAPNKSGASGTHIMWDPRITFDADGVIYVGNTQETSVSSCNNAPATQPTNIVMRLKNNQWESLSTVEKGFVANGYTCGWGRGVVQSSKDGKIYSSGGSGQFYLWNEQTSNWNLVDQYGYPPNFNIVNPNNTITSAPNRGGRAKIFNDKFTLNLPMVVEGQNCEAFAFKSFITAGTNGLIANIQNKHDQNCGSGFPSPSTVNGGKTNYYSTQEKINQEIAGDPNALFSRGLYYISTDESQKTGLNLDVDTASYLLSKADINEEASSIALQDNEQVVVAANIDNLTVPANTQQFNLLNSTSGNKGKIIRLNNNGTELISITTLGDKIDQIEVTADNKIIAIGDFGVVMMNPAANEVLWSKSLGEWRKDRRMSVSSDGKIATLNFKTIQIWSDSGEQIGSNIVLTDSYVEDIALDSQKNTLYIGGFNNTFRNSVPVQIAYIYNYSLTENKIMHKTWNYNPATLGNDMADTRIYRLALNGDNSKLYVSGESAGGNTIFRWNGKDLNTRTGVSSGPGSFDDMWMAKSDAHLAYTGEIDINNGNVVKGSFNTSVLRIKQRLNTTKPRGDMVVDANGVVYVTGTSAAHIPNKVAWSVEGQKVDGGLESGYAGADPYILGLNPDFKSRKVWTTFGKNKHAGDMRSIAIRGNKVAILSNLFKGEAITSENAIQKQPGESLTSTNNKQRDLYFAVWDTTKAFK
jgi:hypothetical protein